MQKFLETVKPVGARAFAARLARTARSAARTDRSQAAAKAPAPLGNNTKSQAALEVREHQNPECIQRFSLDDERREYVQVISPEVRQLTARNNRFSAQSSAAKLLHAVANPRAKALESGSAVPAQWRVTGCTRRKISDHVTILYAESIKKAHFGNLMICGSVWTCSVCSAKISEARKEEIKRATDQFCAGGGVMYMVSFTFSHKRNDDVSLLLQGLGKAFIWMRQHRKFKNLMRDLGFIGDIRALETTYGDKNGWHPHEHGLWLLADALTDKQLRSMQNVLFELWLAACKRGGLGLPNRKRGIDIRKAESAADYLAKTGREQNWGVSSELSKQHVKTGKADGMTPFDLLRSYEAGNAHHGALFIEYAKAFFGKQQIRWSRGLKALFGIANRDDQELAEDQIVEAKEVLKIGAFEWRVILKKPYDVRALLLSAVEAGGAQAADAFITRWVAESELLPF